MRLMNDTRMGYLVIAFQADDTEPNILRKLEDMPAFSSFVIYLLHGAGF